MKKKFKIILLITFLAVVMAFGGMSYFIGSQVFQGSTQLVTNKDTAQIPQKYWKQYGIDYDAFCSTYKIEKVELTSTFDDHVIPADYIYAKQAGKSKDNKTVVMVHGLGGNRTANYPFAEFFLEKGYNVLTYDQRSSNENTARYTTFGYWEKYDLIDCIDFIKEKAPDKAVGVWGCSFGGATTAQALGYEDTDEKVDFAILDSPVSSMKWLVSEQMRTMDIGLPLSYMTWCGSVVNQLKLGFSYEDADASGAMAKVKIPVLIINSKKDAVTPYFMGKDLYDSIESRNKELWTVEDSKHAEIWVDHNEQYKQKISKLFL